MSDLSELNYVELSQEVADEVQAMALHVATLARQLVALHRHIGDIGTADQHARSNLEFCLSPMLEALGNLLNGMDTADESHTERANAMFDELRRRFPAAGRGEVA